MSPPSGCATNRSMSCSRATTSWISESISGTAVERGTGVTRLTQCEDSRGVSTGTGSIVRRGSSATSAKPSIICR